MLSISIVFLGTSASIPTQERSLSAVAVQREGELLLFDCGEGTQRQMIKSKIGFNRKTLILITHMHGDHILGIPGILQTMSLLGREKELLLCGPPGIHEFIEAILKTVGFTLRFKLQIYEAEKEGLVYEDKEYQVLATYAEHSILNVAYAIIEKKRPGRFYPDKAESLGVTKGPLWSKLQKNQQVTLANGNIVRPENVLGPPRSGRKIVYTGDTRPSEKIVELAKGADVLIHEAAGPHQGHSTPYEAGEIASRAQVGKLYLIHYPLYGEITGKSLIADAKKTFRGEVILAEDFMEIEFKK